MGVGIALCASCPGTVYSQLGMGSISAWAILGGALCGAAMYGAAASQLASWPKLVSIGQPAWLQLSLDELLHEARQPASLAFLFVLLAVDIVLELAIPPGEDASSFLSKHELRFPTTVMPFIAGGVLGLLQIVLFALADRTLGSSGSYAALLDLGRDLLTLPTSRKQLGSRLSAHSHQLLIPAGLIVGSFLYTLLSGYTYKSDALTSLPQAALGGAVMVFGARLAGGCTSGHGVTGCGLLSIRSFLATAVMFGAAMVCVAVGRLV